MKIGIFGGSFDPVHNDHVGIVKEFKKVVGLDKVIVVPTYLSPFKGGHATDGAHRKKMLHLAFKNLPYVLISDYELSREQKSYTYITVEHFKSLYPNDELYLLIGLDSLVTFLNWKNPQSILSCCTLCVAGREGYDLKNEESAFKEKSGLDIISFSYDGVISSTYVRELLKLGCSPIQFVDFTVCEYIKTNGLYKGDKLYSYLISALKPSRLFHTAGVVAQSISYAKKLGESVDKAHIAGLLHDVAKYEKAEDYPECAIDKDVPSSVKHQFLGAYIAQKKLGIKDEEILNAIKYHTTGRPNMGIIEKIVFVADLLEPSRNYEEVDYLRDMVNQDFESGFKLCVKRLLAYLNKSGDEIYYLTRETNEFYNK